jgi:hypothetical protein
LHLYLQSKLQEAYGGCKGHSGILSEIANAVWAEIFWHGLEGTYCHNAGPASPAAVVTNLNSAAASHINKGCFHHANLLESWGSIHSGGLEEIQNLLQTSLEALYFFGGPETQSLHHDCCVDSA